MKIVADTHIPFLKGVFEPFADVVYLSGNEIGKRDVKDADALIVRTRTKCNDELLFGTKVKLIASATIGYDHIDIDYCTANGISWATAPGCNAAAVQQWVGAAIVKWIKSRERNPETLTLGVVGVGNVGQKVVELGRAFGMKVICCDPPRDEHENLPDFLSLEELLGIADIITFHVPLTKSGKYPTYHMLNETSLQLCKPNALFVNSSRGGVIDEGALLTFLRENPKADAAIDVWENEPNLLVELAKRAIVATPHIAGYSLEGKVMATKMAVEAVSRFFKLGLVDWWPNPNPLNEKFTIKGNIGLFDLIQKTYNIDADDIRSNSQLFEEFRNTYKYRRDFSAYIVSSCNVNNAILKRIGFQVL
ncbi:4-phosphoerythronate dehydrogenase [Tenuifilum thalassicum]|uniref:Erythronate-4-phosphate dehydrogenase n=1 Tax=Tenuifilum thalassicum TaxID=2590900 RepID=A0A7D3XW06_9BACT|nr:4-phosphoerythronate dehydrogenase [Tenuifilum thalassicum]QKG80288.1 4-phosphoerythronate dehydrogenase [Tenuifilum thalassicum]